MNTPEIVATIAALIATATVIGLVHARLNGRATSRPGADVISAADISAELGRTATLVQFSSEICSSCVSTRRVLAAAADEQPGTAHIDVDVAKRPDLASRFNVLQTPTTLVLDHRGAVRARIGGSARPEIVRAELSRITV